MTPTPARRPRTRWARRRSRARPQPEPRLHLRFLLALQPVRRRPSGTLAALQARDGRVPLRRIRTDSAPAHQPRPLVPGLHRPPHPTPSATARQRLGTLLHSHAGSLPLVRREPPRTLSLRRQGRVRQRAAAKDEPMRNRGSVPPNGGRPVASVGVRWPDTPLDERCALVELGRVAERMARFAEKVQRDAYAARRSRWPDLDGDGVHVVVSADRTDERGSAGSRCRRDGRVRTPAGWLFVPLLHQDTRAHSLGRHRATALCCVW